MKKTLLTLTCLITMISFTNQSQAMNSGDIEIGAIVVYFCIYNPTPNTVDTLFSGSTDISNIPGLRSNCSSAGGFLLVGF